MFAGKSEELIRRARRGLYAKKRVQVFKPDVDRRFDEQMVVTHLGVRHEATSVTSVADLRSKVWHDAEIILVEEAQFFDSSIVEWATSTAAFCINR